MCERSERESGRGKLERVCVYVSERVCEREREREVEKDNSRA